MSNVNDFNQKVIAEFRANGGKVGGPFADRPLLLLNTIGAKSGQPRTNPVVYTTDGDDLIVIASNGGADHHPDWYYNVKANPNVTIELGEQQFSAHAEIAEESERDRLFSQMATAMPGFADYQRNTARRIPVVILHRRAS